MQRWHDEEYLVSRLERKETNERGARENDLEGWRTGRIYPLGHRGFELFVQQVALS